MSEINNWRATRLLNISNAELARAREDLRTGRRPEFDVVASIVDQARDWSSEESLHPAIRTALDATARSAANLLTEIAS